MVQNGFVGEEAEKTVSSGGGTVVVGVKLDSPSKELLTWALVKMAQPGDSLIALHVLEIVDRDGKSSLLSLVKAFNSVLERGNYNFTNRGPDPTINPAFVPQLRSLCPQNSDGSRRIDLDTGSGNRFDAAFFANLRNGRGVLESDQKLRTDASTRTFVHRFLGERGLPPLNFNVEFTRSMVKMSNFGVKTDTNGEIRRICSVINQ
ncbi:peroxidase N1-like [Durio zibethinus]|uniref:peroxidase n=1 Tax=Durio zibethinus TaxID=66656 RepID=A0A6P6ABD1_DURZI|nr:peroxidase N1-like [Durio zibethinus]